MQVTEVQECLLSSIRALTFERNALEAKVNELREVAKSAAGLQAALDAANEELKVRRFENKQAKDDVIQARIETVNRCIACAPNKYVVQDEYNRGSNNAISEFILNLNNYLDSLK